MDIDEIAKAEIGIEDTPDSLGETKKGITSRFQLLFIPFLVLLIMGILILLNSNRIPEEPQEILTFNAVDAPYLDIDTDTEFITSEIVKYPSNDIIKLSDVFIKNKEPICEGSICSFEFNINNPLTYKKEINMSNLLLWYLKTTPTSNIKKFTYYQFVNVEKSKKQVIAPRICSYVENGMYENGSEILDYKCSEETYKIINYYENEWKEIDITKEIILNPSSANTFKVVAEFKPMIGENSIDWKIALNDKDTGYLEPDWVLFNNTKDAIMNISFTNLQGITRTGEWVQAFLNLNATTNLTIGFTAKNIYKEGQNYSLGYKTNCNYGICDLQLVNDSFTAEASEVAFYIYNTTQSYLTTRNYIDEIANNTYIGSDGSDSFFRIGNNKLSFRIDNGSGGVNKMTMFQNTRNTTCIRAGNDCISVTLSDGTPRLGGLATVSCVLIIDTDAYKKVSCYDEFINYNYTIYEGIDSISMEYSVNEGTNFENVAFRGELWNNNLDFYYVNGTNLTTDDFRSVIGVGYENVTISANNDTYIDYWLWRGDYGNAYRMVFRDTIYLGKTAGAVAGKIPANTSFKLVYGLSDIGQLNGTRGTIEWTKFTNPLKTLSQDGIPQPSAPSNNNPNFIVFPILNSTDPLQRNSRVYNLSVHFKVLDKDNASLLYNVTWFTNNLTNFTIPSRPYTNNTFITDILDYRNLTVGQTWKARVAVFDGVIVNMSNSSELLIVNSAPTVPDVLYPPNNITTANYTINLSCGNSVDIENDTIKYEFYLEREINPPNILINNATSSHNVTNLSSDGIYYWRCRTNDGSAVSDYNTTSYSFTVDRRFITFNTTTTNATAVYSSRQGINLNITFNNQTTYDIIAKLILDGTSYDVTKTNISNNQRHYNKIVSIGSKNTKSIIWNLTIIQLNNTLVYNTSFQQNMTIVDDNFALCNSSLTSPVFLNISFKDEISGSILNATVDTSTFEFYVDDDSYSKTYNFVNNSANQEYVFCGVPPYSNLKTEITDFIYHFGASYPARTYAESIVINNASYNKTLYLLSASSGSYTTFQVLSPSNSPIPNVYVTSEKQIGGVYTFLEGKYTDNAGGATFFVNPTLPHRFIFTKSGYNTYTTILTPTQSSYTVTMQTTTPTSGNISLNRGISYIIMPDNATLNNDTTYTFSFDITSSYSTLDEYGFWLSGYYNSTLNNSLTQIIKGTEPAGSKVSTAFNTGNFTQIIMNYYWVINSTYANGTNTWNVFTYYKGSASLLVFCDDLKNFSKSGFNDFTRAIIAFFIIFLITASVSYVTGLGFNLLGISGLITALTFFFDECGDMIPNPVNAIPHFIPIVLTLVTLGFLIDEVVNKR